MITRSVRSAIIGHLLSSAGLKSSEDVSKSLRPYQVVKDNEDPLKIIHAIQNTMNPFELEPEQNLYCLITGLKVADNIRDDLLSCRKKGEMWHDEFSKDVSMMPLALRNLSRDGRYRTLPQQL